jgi:hypothetical protein
MEDSWPVGHFWAAGGDYRAAGFLPMAEPQWPGGPFFGAQRPNGQPPKAPPCSRVCTACGRPTRRLCALALGAGALAVCEVCCLCEDLRSLASRLPEECATNETLVEGLDALHALVRSAVAEQDVGRVDPQGMPPAVTTAAAAEPSPGIGGSELLPSAGPAETAEAHSPQSPPAETAEAHSAQPATPPAVTTAGPAETAEEEWVPAMTAAEASQRGILPSPQAEPLPVKAPPALTVPPKAKAQDQAEIVGPGGRWVDHSGRWRDSLGRFARAPSTAMLRENAAPGAKNAESF